MKTTFIVKAVSIILGCTMLVLFWVSTGSASSGANSGDGPSALTTCADKSSIFPAFVYTKLNMSHNRSFVGFEIHLSNRDGDCTALLYSSNTAQSSINLGYRQNPDDMVIVSR